MYLPENISHELQKKKKKRALHDIGVYSLRILRCQNPTPYSLYGIVHGLGDGLVHLELGHMLAQRAVQLISHVRLHRCNGRIIRQRVLHVLLVVRAQLGLERLELRLDIRLDTSGDLTSAAQGRTGDAGRRTLVLRLRRAGRS